MGKWRPAAVEKVKAILAEDLLKCDAQQVSAFSKYSVEPYLAPIIRYGVMERVVVVARNRNEVIYWEDVEEGFNLSPIAADGQILEHWCNDNLLGWALNAWVEGREAPERLGPGRPPKEGELF